MTRIAIIGAGLSGLVAGKSLSKRFDVQIFEKSRGAGGRMATRRAEPYAFDHGAQFFTAKSDAFRDFVTECKETGLVEEWRCRTVSLNGANKEIRRPMYVASPSMSSLAKDLARGLNVNYRVQISELKRDPAGWVLLDSTGAEHGVFDWVVSSAPAPQTASLFGDRFVHDNVVRDTRMFACYTLMVGLDGRQASLPWTAAFVGGDSPVDWIAVNSDKPGRPENCLIAHSKSEWSEVHIEDDQDLVKAELLAEVEKQTELKLAGSPHVVLHRWRYANVDRAASEQSCLVDKRSQLLACGDWCTKGRVEAAFLSGRAAARHLETKLTPWPNPRG
uniref:Amine oxidase domain-containing protein n=1 Tax=Rhodosorus marinus TaxID=101924 RepID=A0A7S3A0M6_9RHOD|mmetsp:Transcript_40209/g.159779  ORF Transcript_40209/g.159779 Transcript_40209/m.159779 type:complete len:332 (+) Transcript_40209:249-1244(+)